MIRRHGGSPGRRGGCAADRTGAGGMLAGATPARVYSTVVSSLQLTAAAGIVCGVIMYLAAGLLADVFRMPEPGGVMGVLLWGAVSCYCRRCTGS